MTQPHQNGLWRDFPKTWDEFENGFQTRRLAAII
jgi:hypothetical protein